MLNQGIPTGGKHSVPLANILLTFVLLNACENDDEFKNYIVTYMKLFKRFIDDCFGILQGSFSFFLEFYTKLQEMFRKFDLELTCDTDTHKVEDVNNVIEKEEKFLTFLDIDVFKANGIVHSKEHRKETSVNSYLPITSAHPRHTFAGIVKSQLFRLRKLCSRECDFQNSVKELKKRCLRSGYSKEMVENILCQSVSLQRTFTKKVDTEESNKTDVRLVLTSGTWYAIEFVCKEDKFYPPFI